MTLLTTATAVLLGVLIVVAALVTSRATARRDVTVQLALIDLTANRADVARRLGANGLR